MTGLELLDASDTCATCLCMARAFAVVLPTAKCKGTFLHSAVSSPWDYSKQFTPWQTCSFQRHLDFSGKHSATLQLLREDYSFRYPSLSVARYSFVQLSELWKRGWDDRNCRSFETAARGFERGFFRLRVYYRSNRYATVLTATLPF